MKKMNIKKLIIGFGFCILIISSLGSAKAATITLVSDIPSSNKISTYSDHNITFTTPTGVDSSSDTITVTMPAGFTMGSVSYSDIDLLEDGVNKALAGSPATDIWGCSIDGQVITFTAPTNAASGEIDANDVVTIKIGKNASSGLNQIQNSSSTGAHVISIGGTFGDSGGIAMPLVSDDSISVEGIIYSSLSLSLSSTSIDLSDFSSILTGTTSMTATVNTNAPDGYTIAYNITPLAHKENSSEIITPYTGASSSVGTEGWGINLKSNSTPVIGANPTQSAGTTDVSSGGDNIIASDYKTADTFKVVIGSNTNIVVTDGTSNNAVYTVSFIANAGANTEAGGYSTTIDFLIYGNF